MPLPLTLCAVSRLSREAFVSASLLARSLAVMPQAWLPRISLLVDNGPPHPTTGLSEAYNQFLDQAPAGAFLLFVHDDVYIHDWFFVQRLEEAFTRFDVVGLAGNRVPDLRQPSWALRFDGDEAPLGWQDPSQLSGAVGHGDPARPSVTVYGPCPAACPLLDGLFLAVNVDALRAASVRFDPRFRFHGYDLDFCRAATAAGLRVGTWPIAVTHASGGSFGAEDWKHAARLYKAKWGDAP